MSKPVFEDVFRFSGRRNRQSYFLLGLVQTAVMLVGLVPLMIADEGGSDGAMAAALVLFLVLLIPAAVSSIASGAQRCRDFGWSGWAVLIAMIPYVGWLFSVAMLFIPGNQGSNRYGPDPLGSRVVLPPEGRAVDIGAEAA